MLTGQYRSRIPKGSRAASDHFAWFVQPYLEQRSKGVVEAVALAAEGLDLTPLQVALLWVRDAPGVTAPLLGARTAGQLAPALATETMSAAGRDRLGPGRRLGRAAPRSAAGHPATKAADVATATLPGRPRVGVRRSAGPG